MLTDELHKHEQEQKSNQTHILLLTEQRSTIPSLTHLDMLHAEKKLEKRKAQYHQFVSLGNWINTELIGLQQKKKLVHDDNDPSCPLCEQNLSASRKRFIKANFDKTETFLLHRLKRLKCIIPLIKEQLVNEHAQLVKQKQ